ncbi:MULTISPECIES: hypothetical protein [unclassified Streptomyces]|uniref:hypothetical protein n=1 Tax=unclassified Streptomyces TaxID=2593676 RepID=UPI000FFEC3E9|nr:MULTISPECIES: hypothetical protein [unclassified Streptomyces]
MSGPVKRGRSDHQHAAQQAQEMPGLWVMAGTYPSSATAKHMANQVRSGERLPAYRPRGAFEARTELTQEGADLWVRYMAPDGEQTDFQKSVTSGLTEDLDAFSRRLDEAMETTRRTR